MKIQPRDKRALLRAALGEIKSDLAIKNVQLVNVITGEIYPASVYVYDGFIAHVEYKEPGREEQFAKEVVDGQGKYLIPGLIDAHEHIESSMMTPRNFAKAVIPKGTTTVITDPHEIGNVWGIEGVRYMHEASEGLPMRQLIDIPSCVPAVPGLEHAGAEFGPAQIEELAKLERVVGLAEVMDYLDVIHGGDRMMDIIRTAQEHGLYLQGHAPFVEGRMLSAYLCGGPNTCHESRTAEEALEDGGMQQLDAGQLHLSRMWRPYGAGLRISVSLTTSVCAPMTERPMISFTTATSMMWSGQPSDTAWPVAAIKSATLNSARGDYRYRRCGAGICGRYASGR